jgi:mono/diheme cytochrome c family protein
VNVPTAQLGTLQASSRALCAALLAMGCGGSNNATKSVYSPETSSNCSAQPTAAPGVVKSPRPVAETCADNLLLAGCLPSTPPPIRGSAGLDPNTPIAPSLIASGAAALAKAAAENVLAANCGQCHGPTPPGREGGGMDYINDIDRLVGNSKIIPLDSAGSRVIQRMTKGEMPPPSSGLPAVTEADINTLAQFIDNPRFWPTYTPADCSSRNQLTDFDSLFHTIDGDLMLAKAQDTQFYRYIALTNRFTAGVCADAAMDQDRQAIVKMMNMLSDSDTLGKVVPIDQNQTIFRIDLRDFNWNHPVTINGQTFADVWEATAANNPFNVQWNGADASVAIAATKTHFPFQMSDMMMRNSTIGNVYYGIIGIDINQNINDFIANVLQVDVNDALVRAGTSKSRVSRQDRLVQRNALVLQPGALWQSFDLDATHNQGIFQDPFSFVSSGSEAIFTRPNGMLGFLIADANGVIEPDSDILLDTSQNNFRAVTSISCSNCHASGVIPVVDEVKDVALANACEIGLKQDEAEALEDIYVDPVTFATQVSDDDALYQSALRRVDLPTQGVDPVSAVWLRFDADVTLNVAAGDLGLLPSDLKDQLDLVNPMLSVFHNGGQLSRDDFTASYIDSLCRLSMSRRNVPLASTCQQAAHDVEALGERPTAGSE